MLGRLKEHDTNFEWCVFGCAKLRYGFPRAAKADAIVAGDNDLLVLKNHEDIPILSPCQFVQLLNEQP